MIFFQIGPTFSRNRQEVSKHFWSHMNMPQFSKEEAFWRVVLRDHFWRIRGRAGFSGLTWQGEVLDAVPPKNQLLNNCPPGQPISNLQFIPGLWASRMIAHYRRCNWCKGNNPECKFSGAWTEFWQKYHQFLTTESCTWCNAKSILEKRMDSG